MNQNLQKMINEFLDTTCMNVNPNQKDTTRTQYNYAAREFLTVIKIDDLPKLKSLCKEEVLEYKRYLLTNHKNGHFANDTVRTKYFIILSFIKFLHKNSYIQYSPENFKDLLGKELPESKELAPEDLLSSEEVQAICDVYEDCSRDKTILLVLANAGPRVSELTNLKCKDVYQREETWWIRVTGKGQKTRHIPIPQELAKYIFNYLDSTGRDFNSPGILFPSREKGQGGGLSRKMVYCIVERAGKKAGITKPVYPHSLRHFFANKLRMDGEELETIKEMLGHKLIETTLKYTHPGTMLKKFAQEKRRKMLIM